MTMRSYLGQTPAFKFCGCYYVIIIIITGIFIIISMVLLRFIFIITAL